MCTRSNDEADLLLVDGPADESLFPKVLYLGTIAVAYTRVRSIEAADSAPSTDAEVLSNLMKPALADGVVPRENLRASGVTHQLEYVTFSWKCCGFVYMLTILGLPGWRDHRVRKSDLRRQETNLSLSSASSIVLFVSCLRARMEHRSQRN